MGADGKLVLASKGKKALNKPAKLAHKTLLNKAARCVRAWTPFRLCMHGCCSIVDAACPPALRVPRGLLPPS